jgi:hypothetical protein
MYNPVNDMASPQLGVDKARLLYQATKHIQLADVPFIDFKDRLCLAAVATGLRPVTVLEADGLQLERVKDVLINHGLHTLVTNGVWNKNEVPEQHPCRKQLLFLHEFNNRSKARVLWITGTKEQRNDLKSTSRSELEAGLLLGYPICCVEDSLSRSAKHSEQFVAALIKEVGDDQKAFEKAIRDDTRVDVEQLDMSNVPDTEIKFPFAIHVACRACLDSDNSPSATLNKEYEELAKQLDVKFHESILEVSAIIKKHTHDDELFPEMERAYKRWLTS